MGKQRRVFSILSLFPLLFLAPSISPSEFTPRRALAAVWLAEHIYAIGGWNGQATQLNIVEALEPRTLRARPAPPLNFARSQHTAVVADDAIWVIGGWSAEQGLVSAVEVFSLTRNDWRIVTHLPTPRREPAAALLGRRIVIAGGFDGASDGETDAYLDVVEAYDLDAQRWQTLARLHAPRRGLTMVTYDNQLYAMGGYVAGDGYLNIVEQYDPVNDTWQTLDWQIVARTWAATTVVDNAIVIIGGYNRDGFLSLVERVEPRTGNVCYPRALRTPRAWFAAVPYDNRILTLGGEETTGIGNTLEWIDSRCESARSSGEKP